MALLAGVPAGAVLGVGLTDLLAVALGLGEAPGLVGAGLLGVGAVLADGLALAGSSEVADAATGVALAAAFW
ncbi:hypothetical protein [Kitasatospora sp. SUK 42]|uniref:hypothetical protein n=1 Tax=Kitasatospora sp. SUK 42 TaxID=1588882 RepID=UPI0018CADABB|nr:hypothetical protein [Kitasatospora sp. SUK 42]MBV2156384.1 hypothetical protein [Kitasatospora sp. SUK 42]